MTCSLISCGIVSVKRVARFKEKGGRVAEGDAGQCGVAVGTLSFDKKRDRFADFRDEYGIEKSGG